MNQTMKQNLVAIGVASVLGVCSTSALAQLSIETDATGSPAVNVLGVTDIVLFDQTDSPDGNGIPDQDFEAAYDAYDAMAADDFIVTSDTGWTINSMETIGTTGTPGVATVTIEFYPDAAGTPDVANPVCVFDDIVPIDTAGSFSLTFPTSCILPSDGTTVYWVSQFTNQSFAAAGQHFWSGRSVVNGNESQWANPGDGFGTGCTVFSPAGTVCGIGGGLLQDRLFSLAGEIGGAFVLPPPPVVPTLNAWGLGALLATIMGTAMFWRRRQQA